MLKEWCRVIKSKFWLVILGWVANPGFSGGSHGKTLF